MPWVRFVANYVFVPPEDHRVSVAYKAGTRHLVRRVCAEAAIAKGKAVPIERPK